MLIFRPINSNELTQGFGENKACVRTDSKGVPYRPFQVIGTKLFCPLSSIPFYRALGMKGHNGYDNSCYYKEPIYFPVMAECKWWARSEMDADGGVGIDVFSADRIYIDELPKEAGKLARKEWEDNDKRVYVKLRFWHLYDIKLGDKPLNIQTGVFADGRPQMKPEIKLGDCIGWGNSTGASSGNHVHWSMKIVAKNSMTLDADNGYYGAVDFSKWYTDSFILDILDIKIPLTAQQVLRKMAWGLRHIDIKTYRILNRVATLLQSFGIGTSFKGRN